MIHTQKYVNIMEAAGFSRKQAEASIDVLVDVMNNQFATRQDFLRLEQKIDYEIKASEARMTIRLGSMMAIAIAAVATLVKLL